MSLNHLSTTSQGLKDRLNVGCETFECNGTAQFDGVATFNQPIQAAGGLGKTEVTKFYSTTNETFTTRGITAFSGNPNVTLTPAQILNNTLYINTSTNFILPSAIDMVSYMNDTGFSIAEGMTFNFKVVLRHSGSGVASQIDTNGASPLDVLGGATHVQLGSTNGTNMLYLSTIFHATLAYNEGVPYFLYY